MKRLLRNLRFSGSIRQISVVILAFIVNALILLAVGESPLEAYKALFIGAVGSISSIGLTLRWATPLILTGLGVAIAFRCGMFNIGIDGQLFLGAFVAAYVGFTFTRLPSIMLVFIALFFAMVAGALWSFTPGFLRARYGTDEIITSLMMTSIGVLLVEYLVRYPFKAPGSAGESVSTVKIVPAAELPRLLQGSQLNLGLIIAILLAIFLHIMLFKTSFGYKLRMVGLNRAFADYGGINSPKIMVLSMLISGAIAGLAGAIEILGVHRRFTAGFSIGLGFDGIAVALLARNNPLGVLITGLFFGALRAGSLAMEQSTSVPRSVVTILQGVIIFSITLEGLFWYFKSRKKNVSTKENDIVSI